MINILLLQTHGLYIYWKEYAENRVVQETYYVSDVVTSIQNIEWQIINYYSAIAIIPSK